MLLEDSTRRRTRELTPIELPDMHDVNTQGAYHLVNSEITAEKAKAAALLMECKLVFKAIFVAATFLPLTLSHTHTDPYHSRV